MTTRRFTDEFPPSLPEEPATPELPQGNPPEASTARGQAASNARNNAHMPRTLTQVLNEANERVVRGDLVDYVPMPTGFDPLDGFIGGGLRKTELVLLGGAQGIGKTIATLQIARNIASRPDQYAFYLSYEHTETHLMNRLLCLESVNPPDMDLAQGLKLKDLYDIILAERARSALKSGQNASLQAILRDHPKTSQALTRLSRYADRMILVKASPAVTTLQAIREMAARLAEATGGNLTIFVDYLQKVAI